MSRHVLLGLTALDYEHPFDARAHRALESNSALGMTLSKLNQYGIERIIRTQYTGSNLRATRRSFAEVCDAIEETCRTLDHVGKPPEIYVEWDEKPVAITVGAERPVIVVNSGLLDMLSYDELLFALGHEIGHIKSRQVMYGQVAMVLPVVGEIIKSATLGIGGLVSGGIQLSLVNWQRMADFSADRAGLLACQSVETAAKALIKLGGIPENMVSGIDVDGFIEQAREFSGYDFDTLDKLARVVSAMWPDQTWEVMRAAELIKWVDSGRYAEVIKRRLGQAVPPPAGQEVHR
ncbi:MAG: M48 family metallopeptidase [Bacillota bacterium]|nr:M48 family metallopeptidase [Bacillota bacterium]